MGTRRLARESRRRASRVLMDRKRRANRRSRRLSLRRSLVRVSDLERFWDVVVASWAWDEWMG
jgi:hypothetical protein